MDLAQKQFNNLKFRSTLFKGLRVWAEPINTFRLCNLMIAKRFAVLRLEHNGVSLEKRKQQEKEIILSAIFQIVKTQIFFSINHNHPSNGWFAQGL